MLDTGNAETNAPIAISALIFTVGNIKKRQAIAVAIAAVMGYLKVSCALREKSRGHSG